VENSETKMIEPNKTQNSTLSTQRRLEPVP
jgi:hypothetical protein